MALKGKVVMGRKPAAPDPDKFYNKLGSEESVGLIRDGLTSVVEPVLNEYEKQLEKQLVIARDGLGKIQGEFERDTLDPLEQVMLRCWDISSHYARTDRGYRPMLRVNGPSEKHDTLPAQVAKQERNNIQEGFLAKNVMKLSNIIDLKGNLRAIHELPYQEPTVARGGRATMECGLRFEFEDGSEFTVRNRAITNYTPQGKPYAQYPTTFHAVKMPNGTTMPSPASEERMVKIFAAPKTEDVGTTTADFAPALPADLSADRKVWKPKRNSDEETKDLLGELASRRRNLSKRDS
jgi:hypothetical protein